MSPFSGGRGEFMTIEEIRYKRNDGWFLSYPRLAAVIIVFIIGVLAAGFLGWYCNYVPHKKEHDTLDVINDEAEDDVIVDTSLSPYIDPVKYYLDLMPIIDSNGTFTIRGRMVFEFDVNDTSRLSKLSLNAKNITVIQQKLFSVNRQTGEPGVEEKGRKRSESPIVNENHWNISMSGNYLDSLLVRVGNASDEYIVTRQRIVYCIYYE